MTEIQTTNRNKKASTMAPFPSGLLGQPQPAQASSGGLLSIFSDPNARRAFGAGLAQGQTFGEQFGNGLAAFGAYRQQQQAKTEEQANTNRTVEYLRRIDPELAQAAEAGVMSPADAYRMHVQRKKGAAPEFLNVGNGAVFRTDTQEFVYAPKPEKQRELPASAQEYEYARGQGFKGSFLDFQNAKRGNGVTVRGPDGTTLQVGGSGRPLTEAQSKDTVYSTRAAGALPTLDQFGNELTDAKQRAANIDPTGYVRSRVQSPEFQRAQQAGQEFLQAILRKDTGAAITREENLLYGETFLPMPGDGPEVLAQKQLSRRRAIAAIEAGMPPEAILNQERALKASGSQTPTQSQAPDGVDPSDWEFLTPEEKALFQ